MPDSLAPAGDPPLPKFNPFADLLGLRFLPSEHGHCHATIDAGENLLNPNLVVHGGAVYTLADTSMGTALSRALPDGEHCATIEIKISYYAPAHAGRLDCDAHITHRTRRFAFLEAEVRQAQHIIARATGTFVIVRPHRDHGETPARQP
ncbi:MAG: PaaI family thioesterase [Chloroflexi bacterium]|nr:PaaI family thioesterase [Chloroflexota bacterium]